MLWSSDGVCGSVLVLAVREMVMEPHLKLKRPAALCVGSLMPVPVSQSASMTASKPRKRVFST